LQFQFTNMKKVLFFLALVPSALFAQKGTNSANKVAVNVTAENGYSITGKFTGFEDNTSIDLLNPNTGAPEATGKIIAGKFNITGTMPFPDYRVLVVNGQPPYLPLYLDNSKVNIEGTKETFEKSSITGSTSHNEFIAFNAIAKPYEKIFMQQEEADPATAKKAAGELQQFIEKNPNSYITPLAIYRVHQLTDDVEVLEQSYNKLPADVKKSSVAAYLATVIKDNKKFPIGKPLADFSQEDTSGRMVTLSSMRGKYVLVDFWASWCGPCRQENPNIVATFNKYKNKNFTVLGVSLDKSKEPWLEAIKVDGLAWTHVSDLKGWNNEVSTKFEIFSIPQSILLDPQGNVVAKNLRGPALAAKLAELIK